MIDFVLKNDIPLYHLNILLLLNFLSAIYKILYQLIFCLCKFINVFCIYRI